MATGGPGPRGCLEARGSGEMPALRDVRLGVGGARIEAQRPPSLRRGSLEMLRMRRARLGEREDPQLEYEHSRITNEALPSGIGRGLD